MNLLWRIKANVGQPIRDETINFDDFIFSSPHFALLVPTFTV
jgi:hypothetical protein